MGSSNTLTKRIVAWFIDLVIILLPSYLLSRFAGAGSESITQVQTRLIVPLFIGLRDIAGSGPGKTLMGLTVAQATGAPSSVVTRVIRNVPLVCGLVLQDVGFPLQFLGALTAVEVLCVWVTNDQRLGDFLARTRVVRV